jgi:hypothetical protein
MAIVVVVVAGTSGGGRRRDVVVVGRAGQFHIQSVHGENQLVEAGQVLLGAPGQRGGTGRRDG